MLIACLYSHRQDNSEELSSFAATIDGPPPEIAVVGLDRCIITISQENLDAWLNPDPSDLAVFHAIMNDRWQPFYEHRIADSPLDFTIIHASR